MKQNKSVTTGQRLYDSTRTRCPGWSGSRTQEAPWWAPGGAGRWEWESGFGGYDDLVLQGKESSGVWLCNSTKMLNTRGLCT